MNVRTHVVARVAYERVAARRAAAKGRHGVDSAKYGALAHRLPGMLLENGLAQATGFLLSKGNPEHHALLDDLCVVLRAAETTAAADGPGFHRDIIGSDLGETLILTRRSLEAAGWLKRYAQGVLRVDATGSLSASEEPPAGDE